MKYIIAALMIFSFSSCEKEATGYGNCTIGVSNSTPTRYYLQVLLDDKDAGHFFVEASQTGNYTSSLLCNDLVYTANLDNVTILTYVSSGKHTFKLKDSNTGAIKSSGEFTMTADGCISKQVNF